ncbi:hypothetical protein SLE2022_282660 [Rubroshorea leprosula]
MVEWIPCTAAVRVWPSIPLTISELPVETRSWIAPRNPSHGVKSFSSHALDSDDEIMRPSDSSTQKRI